jgi:MFS family permease
MTDSAATGDARPAGILETFRGMPRYTRFAMLGVFVNQFGAFLQAFMVLYLVNRGFSEGDAGLALGAYAAGAILGTLAGGWFTDRLGTRFTIVVAVGSASLLTLSVTMLPNLPSIVVAVFLAGAMTLVSRPAITTLLLRSVPQQRQVMVQAMYRTALNSGAAAGPFVAAWLSTVDWNLVFWFDAAAAMAYCLIALALLPRDDPTHAGPVGGTTAPEQPDTRTASYRTILRDVRYLGYLSVMLANGLVHIQFFVVLPLMLADAGYPTIAYSAAIAVSASFVISSELLITKRTQRWPLWVAVLSGWLLLVAGRGAYGLFELAGGLTIVIIATLVAALGQMVGGPAAFAYPARVAPPGAMGRYIGSAFSTFQIGYTVGPLVGIALWLQLGRPFWAVVAAFGLVMSAVLVWSMRPAGGTGPESETETETETTVAHHWGPKEAEKPDD